MEIEENVPKNYRFQLKEIFFLNENYKYELFSFVQPNKKKHSEI